MNLRSWIPAILFIISSSYTIQHHYGIFNYYNYFSAQEDLEKGTLQLLIYGHIENNEHELIEEFQENLGVTVTRVTDEQADASEVNGIKNYNKVMLNHLEKLHGAQFVSELPFQFQ